MKRFYPHLLHLELLYLYNIFLRQYLEKEVFNIVTQINGKKRKVFSISKSVDKKTLIENIKKDEQIKKYLDNKQIIKTIYIENKLINFIIN